MCCLKPGQPAEVGAASLRRRSGERAVGGAVTFGSNDFWSGGGGVTCGPIESEEPMFP